MAINYNAIEAQISLSIGEGISQGVNSTISKLAVNATALVATYTWNGTGSVSSADTSEVSVGTLIRLDSDGNWFRVTDIVPGLSIVVASDYGAAFPAGSTSSSTTPVTLPAPSSSQTIEDSLGAAIASAVTEALQTFAAEAEISGTTAGIATIGPGVIS